MGLDYGCQQVWIKPKYYCNVYKKVRNSHFRVFGNKHRCLPMEIFPRCMAKKKKHKKNKSNTFLASGPITLFGNVVTDADLWLYKEEFAVRLLLRRYSYDIDYSEKQVW